MEIALDSFSFYSICNVSVLVDLFVDSTSSICLASSLEYLLYKLAFPLEFGNQRLSTSSIHLLLILQLFPALRIPDLSDKDASFLKKHLKKARKAEVKLSAVERVKHWVESHGTIRGCPAQLSQSMFCESELVGEGNYSLVYKTTFRETKEVFALKKIEKEKVKKMSKRHTNIHNEIKMERKALMKLSHPNVVSMVTAFQDASHLCMYGVSLCLSS